MRKIKFKRKPLKIREDLEFVYVDSKLQAYLMWYDYDKRREEAEAERQRQEESNTIMTNIRRLFYATD